MLEKTIVTIPTERAELTAEAEQCLEVARSYSIDCEELRAAASDDLRRVKRLQKGLADDLKSIVEPLRLAEKRVRDHFRPAIAFVDQAESILKRAILTFDAEQERKRREAEADAARKADEERKRLAAAAAKEREAGNVETAAEIVDAAQFVAPVPVVEHAPVRVAGESHREVWSADREHVDVVALAIAIVDGKIAPDNICPNWPVIDGQARALKGAFAMPGVRAICKRILATRAAA